MSESNTSRFSLDLVVVLMQCIAVKRGLICCASISPTEVSRYFIESMISYTPSQHSKKMDGTENNKRILQPTTAQRRCKNRALNQQKYVV